MNSEELERWAEREHRTGMAEWKEMFDHQILAEAAGPLGGAATLEPFGITLADIEQERQTQIRRADAARRRAWSHVVNADQQQQQIEDEYDDDSAECHDEFIAENDAHKAAILRRLDELERLVKAFNDARLDVLMSLRDGDREGAVRAARQFVARPAIAS